MKNLLIVHGAGSEPATWATVFEPDYHVIAVTPAEPADRTALAALYGTWLRLADVVLLDGATLQQAVRWAIEVLAELPTARTRIVAVRLTATQQATLALPEGWLGIPAGESWAEVRTRLDPFVALRKAQSQLQQQAAASLAACRVGVSGTAGSGLADSQADLYRYREALKSLTRLFSERADETALLAEFLQCVRELLGVSKIALFLRPASATFLAVQAAESERLLSICSSVGIGREVVQHVRLSATEGIGGYLARQARVLWRMQAADCDAAALREFELLGTDVAVPLCEDDQLRGVLTFNGKVTGEPISSAELELVYQLLGQLGPALRQRQLHRQLADQEQFMDAVLQHIQTGVIVLGADRRVLLVNPRAAEWLELPGGAQWRGDARRLPARIADALFETLQTGRELPLQEIVLPGSGRQVSLRATRFITGAAGGPVVVGLLEDVTAQKRQQAAERARADRELFARMNERIEAEMKNALSSIKTFAQLLPSEYQDREFREQFSQIVTRDVNRLDVLWNNFRSFSALWELVLEDVPLSELLDTCVANIGAEFARKQLAHLAVAGEKSTEAPPPNLPVITVKKNYAHKQPTLRADRIRLQQAVEHVLRNAVQAMPHGGRLLLSVADVAAEASAKPPAPADSAVRIEITDSGEGIPLADLPHVTEPFFTRRTVGVGLGLTIVQKIVDRHGGQLQIDSMVGRGTTVSIVLPRVPAGDDAPRAARPATDAAARPAPTAVSA